MTDFLEASMHFQAENHSEILLLFFCELVFQVIGADTVGWMARLTGASSPGLNQSPSEGLTVEPVARERSESGDAAKAEEERNEVVLSGTDTQEPEAASLEDKCSTSHASGNAKSPDSEDSVKVGSQTLEESSADQPETSTASLAPDVERGSVNSAEVVLGVKSALGSLASDSESKVPSSQNVASPNSSDYDMLSDVSVGVNRSQSKPVPASASTACAADEDVTERDHADAAPDDSAATEAVESELASKVEDNGSADQEATPAQSFHDDTLTEPSANDPESQVMWEKDSTSQTPSEVTSLAEVVGTGLSGEAALEEVAKAALAILRNPLAQRMTRHNQEVLQDTASKHLPAFKWSSLHYTLLDTVLKHAEELYK